MAAVRVPPSACSTSQSSTIEFSPRAVRSMQARRLRPISREISWVRPPIAPLTLSRSPRVFVARGSIAYSAVTHPRPEPRSHRGTPSVTLAVHRTRVSPNSTSTDPSGCRLHLRVSFTGRNWSGLRPSGRVIPSPYASGPRRPPRPYAPGTGEGRALVAPPVRPRTPVRPRPAGRGGRLPGSPARPGGSYGQLSILWLVPVFHRLHSYPQAPLWPCTRQLTASKLARVRRERVRPAPEAGPAGSRYQ